MQGSSNLYHWKKTLPSLSSPGPRSSQKLFLFPATWYSHRSSKSYSVFQSQNREHQQKEQPDSATYSQIWRAWGKKEMNLCISSVAAERFQDLPLGKRRCTAGAAPASPRPSRGGRQGPRAPAAVPGGIWHRRHPRDTEPQLSLLPPGLPYLSPPLFSQVTLLPAPRSPHLLLQPGNSPIKADKRIMWGMADTLRGISESFAAPAASTATGDFQCENDKPSRGAKVSTLPATHSSCARLQHLICNLLWYTCNHTPSSLGI